MYNLYKNVKFTQLKTSNGIRFILVNLVGAVKNVF